MALELFLGTDGHVTIEAHLWAVLYLLGSSEMLFPLEVRLLGCRRIQEDVANIALVLVGLAEL